ncbi:uncharacterized protein LOC124841014 [Vigna umbellata]|uniref:uncharacterized protein LOC124841014 n=1 Tax=Vigna umbellata TaxID=87088 RepID=UPI001F5E62A4|nr:uncharacterized protein LOC124841014 [Vigna umbellata]XP_047173135.1 uncharacterized protein LOC124841014 [Vigna umbellata]
MAERKLNINAPLMSVRRASATSPSLTEARKKILEKRHSLPYHKSDTTLDQVTKPVAVPFNWEHIPGRRKGNGGSEPHPPKATSITPSPRLPPGNSNNATKQPSERENKAANKFKSSNKSKSFNVSVAKVDTEKERKTEKTEKIVENRRSNVKYDEDDDNDAFSDALETLSHTESFSMNCSVSGVSGLESMGANKSGTFSTDQQTIDFMMSRFLPAAKAMTLQPSQYSSKKQSVLVEQQPRDISKLIREEKKQLSNKHSTAIIPYTGQDQEEESEDEGDGNEYDNSSNIATKGCGLLPKLHIRNSLCLMNPVAAMKMKNQVSLPPASEVVKPNKTSHIRSFSPIPAVKKAWDAIHRNKSSSRAPSPDKQEGKKKLASESNRFTYSGELLPGRLSPFRRSRAAATGISPSRRPQSPFRGVKLLGDSREAENYKFGKVKFHSGVLGNVQDVQSLGNKKTSYSGSLTLEKTLYIDTVSTANLPSSNVSSLDNKRRVDTVVADLERRRGKESNSSIGSSGDIKQVQYAVEEKVTFDTEVLNSLDSIPPSLYRILNLTPKEGKTEGLTTDENINQEPESLPLWQGTLVEDSKINGQQIVLVNDSGKHSSDSVVSPLPPPLPKSPSESWLWRALPLVSVKNSFLHSSQGTQSQAKRDDSNATSGNLKWETIVKTSNLHHDHVRYSQELPTHKSKN